jgi:aspartyl-tRNA synthetase
VKAISVTGGVTKISATRLKKGDVYQQALKSGAKTLPYLKVLEGGELSSRPPVSQFQFLCFNKHPLL